MNIRHYVNLIDTICEGRDAPLYHATNPLAAEEILKSNKLLGKTDQRINGKTVYGVSLTRTPGFTEIWANVKYKNNCFVTLVLDQAKISNTNRIIPLDWFQTYDKDIVDLEIQGKAFGDVEYKRRNTPYMKDEEFVLGDINNLNRILTRIIATDEAKEFIFNNKERFGKLLNWIR